MYGYRNCALPLLIASGYLSKQDININDKSN